MDDRRAMMAAIIANPGEDTPRLALADWLQEHGDKHDQARAEFIRLQIEQHNLPKQQTAEYLKLDRASAKLERKHRKAWVEPLRAIDEQLAASEFAPFIRGLLARVVYDTNTFLKKGWQAALPGAFAAVGVEELILMSPARRLPELAASEAVRWVSSLNCEQANDSAIKAFAKSPHFAHLSELHLDDAKITDAGLKAFAKTAGLARLRTIGLTPSENSRGKYTAAGLLAVLTSKRLPRLEGLDLNLSGGQPAKFDYPSFLGSSAISRLTSLHVGPDAPMRLLAQSPHLTNLRELRTTFVTVTNDDAEAFLTNPAFAKLTTLELDGMNPRGGRLSRTVTRKLRDRFGAGLKLSYDNV